MISLITDLHVTKQRADFPFEERAVMYAVPAALPLIVPVLLTETAAGLSEVQVMLLSVALLGVTVAVRV